MRQNHSTVAHVAYHDLLHSLRDEAVSELRGTLTEVRRGDRTYWYDTYRIGSEVRKTYIGEDTPDLRERLNRIAGIAEKREQAKRHRSRLIRILKGEGFLGVDPGSGSLLNAMQKAGVFRLGGTLVGTIAFRLYEGELGVRYSFDQAAQTNDIDIASFERLSLVLDDVVSEPMTRVLSQFRFDAVPTLDHSKVWRWRQTQSELFVEFLTPSFEEGEGLKPLVALGIHAQSLHYMNFLIAEPIQAAVTYRSGVLVQIPRPERFAVYKLIIADRRKHGPTGLKALKDRAQARFLIDILAEDRPDDLAEAAEDAASRGPRWRERIKATLAREPEIRERLRAAGARI